MASYKGTIKELGMSIFMQGTHQLVDDQDNLVALLSAGSDSVDLNSYLNKKVEVSGKAEPSVEGGETMLTVESVKKL